jgi:hypothetical protein
MLFISVEILLQALGYTFSAPHYILPHAVAIKNDLRKSCPALAPKHSAADESRKKFKRLYKTDRINIAEPRDWTNLGLKEKCCVSF